MISFIKSRDNIVDKMINHLDDASPVGDLLLTLVRCEELPEGQGIVQVRRSRLINADVSKTKQRLFSTTFSGSANKSC
jgi:hypothetical protein